MPLSPSGSTETMKASVETQTSPESRRHDNTLLDEPSDGLGGISESSPNDRYRQHRKVSRSERISTHECNVLLDPNVLSDPASQALVLTVLVNKICVIFFVAFCEFLRRFSGNFGKKYVGRKRNESFVRISRRSVRCFS